MQNLSKVDQYPDQTEILLHGEIIDPSKSNDNQTIMSRGPTMQNIADAAGCSRMTVSLALRNSTHLAESTRLRIQKLAREMGYSPNPLVSTLMAQRAGRKDENGRIPLALINTFENFSDFQNVEFYRLLLDGIRSRSRTLGYYAEVFHLTHRNKMTPRQLDRILLNRGIRGIIILPVASPELTFDLSWPHYSTAAIANTWHGVPVNRSAPDLFGNANFLFTQLLNQGYHRPGLLIAQEVHIRTRGIEAAAYYLFLKEKDLPEIPVLVRTQDTTEQSVLDWLEQYQPDVVVGHGNETRILKRTGWKVPDEIAFANLNLLPSQYDSFCGMDPQPALIGEQAVDLVVSCLHRNEFGLPEHPRVAIVSGQWHPGSNINVKSVEVEAVRG